MSSDKLIISLEELCAHYDAFLLDAHGVFWASGEVGVFPGAAQAMEYLVSHGKHVVILSNTTLLSAKEKEKVKKHGLFEGVHYHNYLTSGEVAKNHLIEETLPFPTPRHTYFVSSPPHPRFSAQFQIFEGTKYRQVHDLKEADFVYISIPHIDGIDQEDPSVFRELVHSIGSKLPLLCANPDRFAFEGSPARPVVRQGSIAKQFANLQAPVYLMGKPSKIIFEAALKLIPPHISKSKIIMVGDTPETDVRGARGVGIAAALMTKTGIMAQTFENQGISAVVNQLKPTDQPEYLLESLCCLQI